MRPSLFILVIAIVAGYFVTDAHAQNRDHQADFLFIGSYHMGNPACDVHNTKADDVLSEKRQREIAEVIRLIERYRPTKVMVEAGTERQDEINSKFAASCKGSRPFTNNEREQLGFRIACNIGLKTVYAVDHDELVPIKDADTINYLKAVERYQQQKQYDENLAFGKAWSDKAQEVLNRGTVLDMLKHLNSDTWLRGNANSYYRIGLLGTPADPVGANWVQHWFGRNLAIFNTIARNTEKGDRVLVIFGAGHGNYLRQMSNDSGIYRVHKPMSWLSAPQKAD